MKINDIELKKSDIVKILGLKNDGVLNIKTSRLRKKGIKKAVLKVTLVLSDF